MLSALSILKKWDEKASHSNFLVIARTANLKIKTSSALSNSSKKSCALTRKLQSSIDFTHFLWSIMNDAYDSCENPCKKKFSILLHFTPTPCISKHKTNHPSSAGIKIS